MKRTAIGILAHVDSGKTTLSEALLYCSGNISRLGRVDHRDSFLDTYALERDRGITIFSKQAVLQYGGAVYYLLDTPGHVDFSAETERTLQVLDYAILVISGTDGVQSHTKTLWRLLQKYEVPCFLFINKMDLSGADKGFLLNELRGKLSDACIDFTDGESEMPLNFKASNDGVYTLNFEIENLELNYLHLIDNITGNDVNLLTTPSYSFEANTTDYDSRFKLLFAPICNDADGDNETFAFINDGNIIIKNAGDASLQIVDMMGRVVLEEAINHVSTSEMAPGVYVLRLINGEKVKTQKIVIE